MGSSEVGETEAAKRASGKFQFGGGGIATFVEKYFLQLRRSELLSPRRSAVIP